MNTTIEKRLRRKKRIRAKVVGTKERPRISLFRSSKHIYAQAINDGKGQTLLSASESELAEMNGKTKIERAQMLGELFGKKMHKQKIKKAVIDRSGYKYHGRVKAFTEGVRKEEIEV